MNFCACVLTAGLLLSATATVRSFDLNPVVKAFNVLEDRDILSKTKVCENPRDNPIGTAVSLKITNCTYPCLYEHGKTYDVKPSFVCGASHTNCRLDLTETLSFIGLLFLEVTVLTLPANGSSFVCSAGQQVSPVFTHTVGDTDPPGNYHLNLKVICDGVLEFCRNFESITDNPNLG